MDKTAYEDLNGWFSSQNIIHMIKSGTMKWAGYVIGRGRRKKYMHGFVRKPDRKGIPGRPRRT